MRRGQHKKEKEQRGDSMVTARKSTGNRCRNLIPLSHAAPCERNKSILRGCFHLLRKHKGPATFRNKQINRTCHQIWYSKSYDPSKHCGIWVNLQCAIITNLPVLFVLAITGPS